MSPGDRVFQDAERYIGQIWGNQNCTGLTFTVSVDIGLPVFYSSNNFPSSEIGPYGNTPSILLNDTSTSNAFTFTTPVSGPSGQFFVTDLGSVLAQSDTYDDGWQLVNGTSASFTTIDDSSAATEPQPGDLFYGVVERNDATMSVHAGIVQSYDPTAQTLTLIDDFNAFRAGNGFPAGGALIGPTTFNLGPPQPAGSGIFIVTGDFTLYRLTDTSAPVEPQSTLPVARGGTATSSHSFLWSEDPDNTADQLTYTIMSGPAHGIILDKGMAATSFTQADIDNGLVRYVENGDVANGDSFTFQVSDPAGNHTPTEPFTIAILDQTGPVVATDNTLAAPFGGSAGLNHFFLDTVEIGSTPDQIIYQVTVAPEHGTLLIGGTPFGFFTQAQIDEGLVQYANNGDGTRSDSFAFVAWDSNAEWTAGSFNIALQPSAAARSSTGQRTVAAAGDAGGWYGSVPDGYQIAGVGDFHGNGSSDILLRNPTSGDVAELRSDNGMNFSDIGWAAPGWDVAGITDLNGDGTADIVLEFPGSGAVGAFMMHDGHPTWALLGWTTPDEIKIG